MSCLKELLYLETCWLGVLGQIDVFRIPILSCFSSSSTYIINEVSLFMKFNASPCSLGGQHLVSSLNQSLLPSCSWGASPMCSHGSSAVCLQHLGVIRQKGFLCTWEETGWCLPSFFTALQSQAAGIYAGIRWHRGTALPSAIPCTDVPLSWIAGSLPHLSTAAHDPCPHPLFP